MSHTDFTKISNFEEAEDEDHELPLLPIRANVVFPVPEMLTPLLVNREKSIAAIESALGSTRQLLVVGQRDPDKEHVSPDDLFSVGTLATVNRILKLPDGTTSVLVEGLRRVRIEAIVQESPHFRASARSIPNLADASSKADDQLGDAVLALFEKATELSEQIEEDEYVRAMNADSPAILSDVVAAALEVPFLKAQQLLETEQPSERLRQLHTMLSEELAILERQQDLQEEINNRISETQHDLILTEQMTAIMDEIGDSDTMTRDIQEFSERLSKGRYPAHITDRVNKEIGRLNAMPPGSPEINVLRNYIEWVLDLPWQKRSRENINIDRAQAILNQSHHGLNDVKDRVLEYLAVRKLSRKLRSPILCFVGPPGVGKTSLGKAIADAMNRQFVRISLGGVRDEAEIRGHRRTYIGSMPGRIIQAMREASTSNPVFMLDEIDKLGVDFRGDPATALLEVLDPEQNNSFSDHYIEEPFDLSKVLFITTANSTRRMPAALVDRMEIVEIPGYTESEKASIAKQFLIPDQLSQHGLDNTHLSFSPAAISQIIRCYTREAGVRELERQLARLCRRRAFALAEGDNNSRIIGKRSLRKQLGSEKFRFGEAEEQDEVAMAMGVFQTIHGGELMPVEVTVSGGSGRLTVTGRVGDVMQESVRTAQTYSRVNANILGISNHDFDKLDFHVHIPAGATPKEGASAGITIATALVSALTNIPVRKDTTMTGELTLQGRVLRTEGLKDKILAAHRAGLKQFILPKGNKRDLDTLPDDVRSSINFIIANKMQDVVLSALSGTSASAIL